MARFLTGLLGALGLPPEEAERIALSGTVALPARVPAAELAADAVSALALAGDAASAARAASELAEASGSRPPVELDAVRIAAAFRSTHLGRIGGAPPAVWDPLSGFFPASDGWVRTHANYPWHAAALARGLGLPPDPARAAVAAAIAERPAHAVEAAVLAAGGLAVAVREADAWAAERGPARPPEAITVRRRDAPRPGRAPEAGSAPLAGVRVLDLTRVIAGPVGTRALAVLGADVLRVDSPRRPEPLWQWLDTGLGKRSALLDLDSASDLRILRELLLEADIVATGSRPGALARFGLEHEQLAEARPELITTRVRAWGSEVSAASDPWARRRGFDSLVQAASGIALREAAADGAPGALPAQVLDHAAGALLAAGSLALLAEGRGGAVEASLEGCAALLLGAEPLSDAELGAIPDPGTLPELPGTDSAWGELAIAPPALPGAGPGADDEGPWAGRAFGEDAPVWA